MATSGCARLLLSRTPNAASTSAASSNCLQASPLLARLLSTHVPAVPTTTQPSVVPLHVLEEQLALDERLRRASRIDGRERLELSSPQLPFAVQPHNIEESLPTIDVHVRPGTGGRFSKWLRLAGRLPARIYSLPDDKELYIHMSEKDGVKLVRLHGRNGCQAQSFRLNVVHPEQPGQVLASIRAKPTAVRAHAATQRLQDIDFLYCPQDRVVVVDVPVRLVNSDAAPGVKKGGWMFLQRRVVRYKSLGSAIPPFLELNVKHLDLEQTVMVKDLPIPPGTKIYEKDYDAVVVRCTTDVGKD